MAELTKWSWIIGVLLVWLAVWLWAWRRHHPRHPHSHAVPAAEGAAVLVAYASQGGTAAELARLSAQRLQREGVQSVQLLPLNAVTDRVLLQAQRALFVASTYGEGEPPDNALAFARRYLNASTAALDLSHLEFSVLALGDRAYTRFCAFGRQLQQWLEQKGAQPVKALLEIDGQQPGSAQLLQEWLGGTAELATPDLDQLDQPWQLQQRQQLNPGSAGQPLYRLQLQALGALPLWRAGDIFQLAPRNTQTRVASWLQQNGLDGEQWIELNGAGQSLAGWLSERQLPTAPVTGNSADWLAQLPLLPHRDYSIASVPQERDVQLLVRLQVDAAGEAGLGSGWLAHGISEGEFITGRIRSNPAFHGVDATRPLILIGSGSGLAGLRAHLAERQQAGQHGPAWLIFGERNRQADTLLQDDLQRWQQNGVLTRLDRCFSRDSHDGQGHRYVQDVLRAHASEVQRWLNDGAALLVCGSREGMGQAVQNVLSAILGSEQVARMLENGDYRRDLY